MSTPTQYKNSAKIINNRLLSRIFNVFKIFIFHYIHVLHLFVKRSHFKESIQKECEHDCRIQDIKLLHIRSFSLRVLKMCQNYLEKTQQTKLKCQK